MNYTDEIKLRLGQLLLSLLDMINSKKFKAALLGGIAAWYTTGDVRYFFGAMGAYIVAQGVADMGKEAAPKTTKIEATELTMTETTEPKSNENS